MNLIVALCLPEGDKVYSEHYRSLERLILPRPGARTPYIEGNTHHIPLAGAHNVDAARRQLTQQLLALDSDSGYVAHGWAPFTHALWIDDDMTFQPDACLRLLKADKDIVGGLCFSRRLPYQPVAARLQPPELGLGEGAHGWVYDLPYDQTVEVDRTGAAFLMIKMEVLRAMAKKYGIDALWLSTESEGEDFRFCRMAQKLGYKIHIDTGNKIGHIAQVVVDEEFAQRNRRQRWQPWASPKALADKTGKPQASIVIPTYNQNPKYLKAAVWSAWSQSVPVEIIVVDDGSDKPVVEATDPRAKDREHFIGMPPGVRVVRHDKNRGIAEALNTGIDAMTTDWFCWLSSDDLITGNKVERQLEDLKGKGLKAGCHLYELLGEDQNPLTSRPMRQLVWDTHAECRQALGQFCCINGSTVMIHKSVIDDVGNVDPSFGFSQDYELWTRIAQKYQWGVTLESLGSKRMDDNLTSKLQKDPERMAKWRECDRRIHEKYPVKVCEHCGAVVG